jgi:proteasome lid subunit RPN8/RPN11
MKSTAKSATGQPSLLVDSEVVRKIRQHARSTSSTEICGVLIGRDQDNRIEVTASIEGKNADQAGAHVTFTQHTWEHIYAVKDKQFPNQRIVGWYHSHPGFGIFLSEHDTFIHKNFFSSPGQVAWVYDPHSDEEGCFGWVNGRIERLTRIAVQDRRGGEVAEGNPEHPTAAKRSDSLAPPETVSTNGPIHSMRSGEVNPSENNSYSLEQMVAKVFFSLALLVLGGLISWYFLPRTVLVPVVIDPGSGKLIDVQTGEVVGQLRQKNEGAEPADPQKPDHPASDASSTEGNNARSK